MSGLNVFLFGYSDMLFGSALQLSLHHCRVKLQSRYKFQSSKDNPSRLKCFRDVVNHAHLERPADCVMEITSVKHTHIFYREAIYVYFTAWSLYSSDSWVLGHKNLNKNDFSTRYWIVSRVELFFCCCKVIVYYLKCNFLCILEIQMCVWHHGL